MKINYFTSFLILFNLVYATLYSQRKEVRFKTNDDTIYGICFTSDGNSLGVADHNIIKIFSSGSRILRKEFTGGHKSQILSIDISKDSSLLVSGGKDSTIAIWNYRTNTLIKSLHIQKAIVTSLSISPDNRYLVSGGTNHKVILYDLNENKIVNEFTAHTREITAVKFSPASNLFASSAGDELIHLYSVENKLPVTTLKGHKNWVRDISFNNDGSKLVSCGDDARVILWDISDPGKLMIVQQKRMVDGWVVSVDFGGKNSVYALATLNGNIVIKIDFGKYRTQIVRNVNKILLQPSTTQNLSIALATRGSGVISIDALDMKLKEKQYSK